MKENPEFLKKKYDLHNAPEVEAAAERTEKRRRLRETSASQAGERLSREPEARIQNYLDRFKEIVERKNPRERQWGMEAIKEVLHKKYVIKSEEIPESYWEAQKKIAREQGRGDIEITPEIRRQGAEIIIADQESSLDNWINYLASEDARFYPDWLKYWATRSVLGMGEYDKEKQQFTKRSKGTIKPFPGLNREALAYVLDVLEKKYEGEKIDLNQLDEQDQRTLQGLLQGENFAKLYAYALEKFTPAGKEALENTTGRWVKYGQGSDPLPLVQSLQGHNTGWCTATSESIARGQLQGGDFYVYYSLDRSGQPSIPRAAILMQGEQIDQVRGIAEQQNLDPYIGDTVKKKLQEFPDGPKYEKKVKDMKFLTAIEKKMNEEKELSGQELKFLYEIDGQIEYFGYNPDPRIEELRGRRNPQEDMPVVFECSEDQIAHNLKEIAPDTKAYVGSLAPGLFEILPESVEHIYTKFPEGKIEKIPVSIDRTRSVEEMIRAGQYDYVNPVINGKNFKVEESGETNPKVLVIGFGEYIKSTEEVLKRLNELGLRPAHFEELVAVGETRRELQRKFPIFALGSGWQRPGGYRFIPYLDDWDGQRELLLNSFENVWFEDYRFAAVRK